MRTLVDLSWESQFGYPQRRLAGVDEVGRGCLAGPVVAAAVVLPDLVSFEAEPWLAEVTDSKLLTASTRERLAPLIRGWARGFAIGVASVEEIDRVNIYHASHLAMRRALDGLGPELVPDHVLIDGNALPKEMPWPATAVIKGDQRCLSIASASILAKVWRDHHLRELESSYPGFGLGKHKGYGTPAHLAALRRLGVTDIHRKSFAPVRALLVV